MEEVEPLISLTLRTKSVHLCRFLDTVHALSKEAGPALEQWELCDNMDLATVLQEYEAYCFVKFKMLPKIAKKRTRNGSKRERERAPWNHSEVISILLSHMHDLSSFEG